MANLAILADRSAVIAEMLSFALSPPTLPKALDFELVDVPAASELWYNYFDLY
jgi:hypothetical protein